MVAVACGDFPNTPRLPTPTTINRTVTADGSDTPVTGLLWTRAATQASVTATIGPNGGSLSITNGIKMVVPKGALSSNVTITITRVAGNVVAYNFAPHGTVFAVPVEISQPTQGTNLSKLPGGANVEGAYFTDLSLLNENAGTADVAEFEPTFVSADKAWIDFTVNHFSGYMVSTGRQ